MSIAERFRDIPTGNICDSNDFEGCMDAEMMPLHYKFKTAGVAMTVTCAPGDNLTIHKAIALAEPGTVLVIDCGGIAKRGVFGELFATSCAARGIVGVVVNGACRDKRELIEMNFPVFSIGVSPNGTRKEVCGEIDIPVNCAGVVVNPGDVIVGDADGVVCVRKDKAAEVLERSKAKMAKEIEMREHLARGKTTVELLGFQKKLNMNEVR
jgi:4-hydroxy-4-methyl-2-oxoglutarate aldolase